MVQNLKVDIIYHQTPSDFEMEFNLCGCCRMRLLNDKTEDKKGFIRSLARAVSRSRVIMICGTLFGENGIINTVSTAISSHTVRCNNSLYGINSDEPIEIINGSTPLVTPDGYFGGCIIESGPQTIILLTENRNFRKVIMQNLIHPYLEEIGYIPLKTSPIKTAEPMPEQAVGIRPEENYITEPDLDYEKSEEAIPDAPVSSAFVTDNTINFIMDGDEPNTENDEQVSPVPIDDFALNNMYVEVESRAEKKSRYAEPYTPSESDSMFITSSQDNDLPPTKKHTDKTKAMDITIIVLVMILLLSILALVYFIVLKPYTMGISTTDYLKEIFGITTNNSIV